VIKLGRAVVFMLWAGTEAIGQQWTGERIGSGVLPRPYCQ
jgi:hypothetical protein